MDNIEEPMETQDNTQSDQDILNEQSRTETRENLGDLIDNKKMIWNNVYSGRVFGCP